MWRAFLEVTAAHQGKAGLVALKQCLCDSLVEADDPALVGVLVLDRECQALEVDHVPLGFLPVRVKPERLVQLLKEPTLPRNSKSGSCMPLILTPRLPC